MTHKDLTIAGVLVALLFGVGCSCSSSPSTPDADVDRPSGDGDADADSDDADPDVDADRDADVDTDVDGDVDLDVDLDLPDVDGPPVPCDDAGPLWSWTATDCPVRYNVPGCCNSCQPLSCRNAAAYPDIWGVKVAYEATASVYVVSLDTGQDDVAFRSRPNESGTSSYSYGDVSISSRYVVARRVDSSNDEFPTRVVAKPIDNLSLREIILEPETGQDFINGIDVYEEWVVWGRRNLSNDTFELVVHNIETGVNRVLDSEARGCDLLSARVWGEKAYWVTTFGEIREQELETGETRTILTNPDFGYMSSFDVWENHAVFTNDSGDDRYVLYHVDLNTGAYEHVMDPPINYQRNPTIHGGRIAWTDEASGLRVMIRSLESGEIYTVSNYVQGVLPTLFDRTLVWRSQPPSTHIRILVTQIADI